MTSTNTRGNKAPSLTLQVGKRYVQRDGTVTGGLVENGNSYYPFRCHVLERNWEADGTWMRGARNQRDIVAEYQEPEAPQEPKEKSTMSNIKLEVGKRYVQHDGTVTGELVENDNPYYLFRCPLLQRNWQKDGTWDRNYNTSYDIVAEYQEPKEESIMSNIKLEVGKTYRTEHGDKALCIHELTDGEFVCVYGVAGLTEGMYHFSGVFSSSGVRHDKDNGHLVSEWIDPPKTKKVLMYQVLYKSPGCSKYSIAKQLYGNEAEAIKNLGSSFIRLLTDRPIEVEVPV